MEIENELQNFTVDLVSAHLSQAINLYNQSDNNKRMLCMNRYNCISSIIHSVSAVEACVSRIAYETFYNKKSIWYISKEKRDIPLNRMIDSWFSVQTLEKINLFLQIFSKTKLNASLESKFRELNNLRNWLVHGFCYETVYLLSPNGNDIFDLIDKEDSISWELKFKINKFNSIDEIDKTDAYKALKISLEILQKLSELNIVSIIINRENYPFITILTKEKNIEDYLI